jgi:hypothetical protein
MKGNEIRNTMASENWNQNLSVRSETASTSGTKRNGTSLGWNSSLPHSEEIKYREHYLIVTSKVV